jgi:hypothetical protein
MWLFKPVLWPVSASMQVERVDETGSHLLPLHGAEVNLSPWQVYIIRH